MPTLPLNPYLRIFEELREQPSALQLALRKNLIWAYAWAIPSQEALEAIAALNVPIAEMGAGTGYWAWLLTQAGCQVSAYDHAAPAVPHWYPVQVGGPLALANHPGSALLLCWPPLNEALAAQSLRSHSGDWVIYVGEAEGGRTADREFFSILQSKYELHQAQAIPQWPGFQDQLWIYKKRTQI